MVDADAGIRPACLGKPENGLCCFISFRQPVSLKGCQACQPKERKSLRQLSMRHNVETSNGHLKKAPLIKDPEDRFESAAPARLDFPESLGVLQQVACDFMCRGREQPFHPLFAVWRAAAATTSFQDASEGPVLACDRGADWVERNQTQNPAHCMWCQSACSGLDPHIHICRTKYRSTGIVLVRLCVFPLGCVKWTCVGGVCY